MELKVMSLNCWGIPMVSSDRKTRMNAIAEVLSQCNYDVVCLQEVWSPNDFILIRDTARGCLPYSHYFYSGVLGSGICMLSKHPISDVHYHKWMLNGYPHKIHHGDWWGGKGVGMCRLQVGEYVIHVYTTHLHAEYNKKHDEYYACRAVQAFEMAKFVEFSSGGADATFLIGDLNTEPGDLPYRLITQIPNLKDSYNQCDDTVDSCTNLHLKNSYTPAKNKTKEIPGCRIDYILYKGSRNTTVNLKEYFFPLPESVPGKKFSYSDHEAIAAKLTIVKSEVGENAIDKIAYKQTLSEAIETCEKAIHSVCWNKAYYWIFTLLLLLIITLSFVFEIPYDIYIQIIRLPLTFLMAYFFFMATFWNAMESNGIYSAKLAMEISLFGIKQ